MDAKTTPFFEEFCGAEVVLHRLEDSSQANHFEHQESIRIKKEEEDSPYIKMEEEEFVNIKEEEFVYTNKEQEEHSITVRNSLIEEQYQHSPFKDPVQEKEANITKLTCKWQEPKSPGIEEVVLYQIKQEEPESIQQQRIEEQLPIKKEEEEMPYINGGPSELSREPEPPSSSCPSTGSLADNLIAPLSEAAKKPKRRRVLSEETKKRKREATRIKGHSRINIGPVFTRWRELKDEEGFPSDAALALFMLDYYQNRQASTPHKQHLQPASSFTVESNHIREEPIEGVQILENGSETKQVDV
ncbi:uncharacterized protein LOC130929294 [Corythoichthys intestinalis]|uniref:uncharacterized protein LOC130929294 n=1 Tax=Corythoichthys intestinalis TaxID=161448 RepID=UPI0025A5E681|nr:uncharacterized protein LOC130929294 [Corythoichthys intestinalis]XP_057712375.1 uncharacterized protein LOC130929294 [Corythoichthys intestinalis]